MNIKQDDLNKIKEKAKTRTNGIYSANGFYYVVKDNKVLYLGQKATGEIAQIVYGFISPIGEVKSYNVKEKLRELLKG